MSIHLSMLVDLCQVEILRYLMGGKTALLLSRLVLILRSISGIYMILRIRISIYRSANLVTLKKVIHLMNNLLSSKNLPPT